MAAKPQDSLRLTCTRKQMQIALNTVAPAVSGRNALPILSAALLEAAANEITLTGYDLEIGLTCHIPADVLTPGKTAVKMSLLKDLVAAMPEGDLALRQEGQTLHVQAGKGKYKLNAFPAEEYPVPPLVSSDVVYQIPQKALKELLAHTLFAAGKDETRALLTGLHLHQEGDFLRGVCTDTHRCAIKDMPYTLDATAQGCLCIVPMRAANEINKLLQETDEPVQMTVAQSYILFAFPDERKTCVTSRLIEGNFPGYKRIIPSDFRGEIICDRAELLAAVRRVALIACENANRILFQMGDDTLTLSANSQMQGTASEEIPIVREGGDFETAFNMAYVKGVLAALDCERVRLQYSEPLKPALLTPLVADGKCPDYRHVLMPMQII